jgi:gas vesicle protein
MRKLVIVSLLVVLSSAGFLSSISNAFNSLGSHIESQASSIGGHISSIADTAASHIQSQASSIGSHIQSQASSIGGHISSVADTAASHIQSQASSVGGHITDGYHTATDHIKSQASSVGGHITDGYHTATDHIKSQANSVGGHIQSGWSEMSSNMKKGFNSAMSHVVSQDQALNNAIVSAADSLASHAATIASFVGHEVTENAELIEKDLLVGLECGVAIAECLPMLVSFGQFIEGEESVGAFVDNWNDYDSDIANVVGNCGGGSDDANLIREAKMDESEQEMADCAVAILDLAVASAKIAACEVDPDPDDITELIQAIMGIAEHCVTAVQDAVSDANKGSIGGGPMAPSKSSNPLGSLMSFSGVGGSSDSDQ